MYICIDFDGTIVDHCYPEIGHPVPMAIETIKVLQGMGNEIILFTMRSGIELAEAVDYLSKNDIELFGVNVNPTQKTWTTSPKAYGHIYIDDAAFGCPMRLIDGFRRPCVDWVKVSAVLVENN